MFWRKNKKVDAVDTDERPEPQSDFERFEQYLKEQNEREAQVQPLLDRHFELQNIIQTRYKERDSDSDALPEVMAACEEMIAIAPQVVQALKRVYGAPRMTVDGRLQAPKGPAVPPGHKGYQQLIIIRKKQGDKQEAERLAKEFELVWHELMRRGAIKSQGGQHGRRS